MSGKRAHNFGDHDEGAKRIRSNNGSPAPAPVAAPDANDGSKGKAADRVAALQAKLAEAKRRAAGIAASPSPAPADTKRTAAPPPPPTDSRPAAAPASNGSSIEQKRADALRQIAEIKARAAGQRIGTDASDVNGRGSLTAGLGLSKRPTGIEEAKARAAELAGRQRSAAPSPSPARQGVSDEVQQRIAEARARAAAAKAQREGRTAVATPPPRQDSTAPDGARGLGIGIHPSLKPKDDLAQVNGEHDNAIHRGRGEVKEKVNPYLSTGDVDHFDEAIFDPTIARKSGTRKSKPLAFVAQGKYVAQSIALKEQAALEAMKRRIALETKKIAIESASDKSFSVPEPPEVEWWDESLLQENHKTYDDWEHHNRIEAADSTITIYVQHPVLLAAPQDKFMPAPKPLMLTTKEMKKLRRQRRMADMKEEQAKVRLGLKEPAPPKVKKSNMMRVYGEQAVKDPTAVEARVNREIAQRAQAHEEDNAARKLTKEQRHEKLKQQQAGDEAKGIKIAVFRVDSLSSGKHRFQIDMNAKQQNLHGIVILHPEINLIIVEGGAHSVNAYKKLMLNRIKWSENTIPLADNKNATFTAAAARNINRDLAEGPSAIDTWLNPLTEAGELKDLSENRCLLVWEGDEKQHAFRKWGSRVCETDGEARDTLARSKMENMWELAKGTSQ